MSDLDQDSAFLPRDLPPRVWRNLAWLMVAIVGAAVLGAIVVKLPETVESRFVLLPADGADPLKAPVSGTIDRINVSDGSEVRQGDLLLTIRSEEFSTLLVRIAVLENQVDSLRRVDAALVHRQQTDLAVAKAQIARLRSQLAQAGQRRSAKKKRLSIYERSYEQKLISELEVLDARDDAAEAEQQYRRLAGDLEQAKANALALARTQQQELAERALDLAKAEGDLAVSKAARDASARDGRTDDDQFEVRAPYDGTVVSLGPRRTGVVIERGDLLCTIARADARLVAELSVPELESGRLDLGQRVALLLDAFPHIRYGTRTATVTWISPTAVEGRMRAHAALIDRAMIVEGIEKPLRAGMVGRAHVLVSRRTLAEFALEPLYTLRENSRRWIDPS
jgi:multidrug efflux pump subunit AcrA (membrane-fusion protein)